MFWCGVDGGMGRECRVLGVSGVQLRMDSVGVDVGV